MQIHNVEQNSPAWMNLRLGIITASSMKDVLSKGRSKTATSVTRQTYMDKLMGEQLSGRFPSNYTNEAMMMGHELEKYAREYYERATGNKVTQVGFITNHDDIGTVGFSPDGLIGEDGVLEIKSRMDHVQVRVLLNDAPSPEHYAQMQCGLWVSERQWCDYVSFNEYIPPFIRRVHRDDEFIANMREQVIEFYAEMTANLKILTDKVKAMPVLPDVFTDLIEGNTEIKDYRG
jgi:predicted phage-related endonuclease